MSDLYPEDLQEVELTHMGDDWIPTPHGEFMAAVLSEHNMVRGKRVLELGAGVANHTILLLRQGAELVVATEITEERLATARANVEHNCPGASNIEYRVANWLDTPGSFEVIVTNPPFAKSGKRNRRYFIDALILDGHEHLEPGGSLIFVQSSMADLAKTTRRLEENGFEVRVLDQRRGPFRDYYFEDESFMEEIQAVPDGFEIIDGVHHETLFVIEARLLPWRPPRSAH